MKHIQRAMIIFSKAANLVCIAAIAVMMCAVFADVIMRTFFNSPITGVTELTQCCWVLMTLSFGVVIMENANTMVDIFVEKMPPQVKRIVILLVDLCAIAYSFIIGWRTIIKSLSSKASNIMYVMLGVKEWPFMMAFALSFIVAGVATILITITEWQSNTAACREWKQNGGKKKEKSEEA